MHGKTCRKAGQSALQRQTNRQTDSTQDRDKRCGLNPKPIKDDQSGKGQHSIACYQAQEMKQRFIQMTVLLAEFDDQIFDHAR